MLCSWNNLGDGRREMTHRRQGLVAVFGVAALLIGCDNRPKPPEAVRPVRTVVAALGDATETLDEVGEIQARYETDLSFRIGGKLIERSVDVGTSVTADMILAALDPAQANAELRSAQ